MSANRGVVYLRQGHVCFKRSPTGLEMRDAFDAALKKNDPVLLEAEYFRTFPLIR